jgi:hypothetical protein
MVRRWTFPGSGHESGVLAAAIVLALGGMVQGRWLNYPTPAIPTTADGKARMDAPTPRPADGGDVADYVRALTSR